MTQIENSENDEKDPRTHAIIGAAMEVHNELGSGFLEAVYAEAFSRELAARGIAFAQEVPLDIFYKGVSLNLAYRADFICFDQIVVELKALRTLSGAEESQVINYLRASNREIGLLLNFGSPRLQFKRLIFTPR